MVDTIISCIFVESKAIKLRHKKKIMKNLTESQISKLVSYSVSSSNESAYAYSDEIKALAKEVAEAGDDIDDIEEEIFNNIEVFLAYYDYEECEHQGAYLRHIWRKQKRVTILNTSILTAYGDFRYEQIDVEQAKNLIAYGFESAVGHASTADILTQLLDTPVPMNRTQFSQELGDIALVFKLNGRAEEGKILTVSEIEAIGYEFGILERTA